MLTVHQARADYFCRPITRKQQQGFKSIEPTKEAVDDFIALKDRFVDKTVWQQDCRSWYKGNTLGGKIVVLWAGSTLHYMETLKEVQYKDSKVNYFGNRWDYLGNGMTNLGMMPDADLSTYIRTVDDAPIIAYKFTYKKAGPELPSFDFMNLEGKSKVETCLGLSREIAG